MGKLSKFFKKLFKRKKKKAPKKARKKSDERKIYKTTDGYFNQNPNAKKPRYVAVVKQRKDDGALAVCKIYSKEGKEKNDRFMKKPVLKPEKHPALSKESIVEKNVKVGVSEKVNGKKTYKAIYKGDLQPTSDELTKKEHRQIMKNLGGGNEKYKQTNKETLKKWEKHFKK